MNVKDLVKLRENQIENLLDLDGVKDAILKRIEVGDNVPSWLVGLGIQTRIEGGIMTLEVKEYDVDIDDPEEGEG